MFFICSDHSCEGDKEAGEYLVPFSIRDDQKSRKYNLMKWEDEKNYANKEGLGIKLLVEVNKTLQGKWLWRYRMKERRLWSMVIEARWGTEMERRDFRKVVRPYGMGRWRKIGSGR